MPQIIRNEIDDEKPLYFNCTAKICSPASKCEMDKKVSQEVFVEHAGIFSNTTHYNPRKLNLFCWEK